MVIKKKKGLIVFDVIYGVEGILGVSVVVKKLSVSLWQWMEG